MNAATFCAKELVRVVAQPHSLKHLGDMVGKVGYIEELSSDGLRALFNGITLDGRFNGMGWIPVKCLVHESSQKWENALHKFDNWMNELQQESESYKQKYDKKVQKIASECGLTVEKLLEISQAVNCLV